jgi:hypothetical protein
MKKKQQTRQPQRQAPDDFCEWWNPSGREKDSGADIGGHPDAKRVWARKDSGRWTHRTYGITAAGAWQVDSCRKEYWAWVDANRPKSVKGPFVSLAATLAQQGEFWTGLKTTLAQIVKPMPKEDKQPLPKALPESNVVDAEFTKLEGDNNDEPIPF